jgi:hypothetical protein
MNFIGNIVSVSIDEKLVEKNREEQLRCADPIMMFGVDVMEQMGWYARIGDVTRYAPPETDY